MCKRTLALISLLSFAACTSVPTQPVVIQPAPPPIACTLEAVAGITVKPVDSETGAVLSGPTTLIVREGLYADTVRTTTGALPLPVTVSAAYERAGTYTIVVRHPGYREFAQTGVEVTRDPCHVHPVRITAELRRAG